MNRTYIIFFLAFITTSFAAPNDPIGGRIMGGQDAKEGQFPYIVSLTLLSDPNHPVCAGSIISQNIVLTAAQCVYDRLPSNITVRAQLLKFSEGGDSYQVEKFIVHEEYYKEVIKNDIALVFLAENITLSDNVKIVKLHEVDRDENEECVLSGWGVAMNPHDPDNLQFLNVTTTTRKECYDAWVQQREIYDNTTCTFTKEGVEGACFRDFGGPLVDAEGTQIGIVSLVKWCAVGWPDVYTRIASYIDWIKKNANLD